MARAMYVVHVEVDPAAEAAWLVWQFESHVPDVVREGRFVRARRFSDEALAPDGWKRHTILYEATDRAALQAYLEGEPVKRLRADYQQRFGTTTRLSRQLLVEEGPVIRGNVAES